MDHNIPRVPGPAESTADGLDAPTPARMAANPAMPAAIGWLQDQAADTLAALIEQMAESLPVDLPRPGTALNVREMAAASRHAPRDAQERRELAEALVISALLNCDNPDWDPSNPATHRPNVESPFVQLLQMKLGEAQS